MRTGDPQRGGGGLSGAGLPGEPTRPQPEGTAHVESRISTPGGAGPAGGAAGTGENLADRASNRAREMLDDARERADELGDQASDTASRARRQANRLIDRAEDQLEQQTGIVSMVREYPLVAVGLAFGTGFLLAGSGGGRKRGRVMNAAMGQLRTAVMSGIAAIAAQELNALLGGGETGSDLINALTGHRPGR